MPTALLHSYLFRCLPLVSSSVESIFPWLHPRAGCITTVGTSRGILLPVIYSSNEVGGRDKACQHQHCGIPTFITPFLAQRGASRSRASSYGLVQEQA